MPYFFRERTSDAPPSGRFAVDIGSSVRTFVMYDPTQEETGTPAAVPPGTVTSQVRAALGTTNPGPAPRPFGSPGGRGSLDRVMPWVDPLYLSLFADQIAVNVKPMEGFVAAEADTTFLAVPPVQTGYAGYQSYEFVVDYQARPFPILPNERMNFRTADFYSVSGTATRAYLYPEWLRHAQRFTEPMDSRISASVASAMVFYAPDTDVHQTTFSGIPDMAMPDVGIKIRWWGIPARYLDSDKSWLLRLRGKINYNEFLGKPPGSMLYEGCKVIQTYTPTQFEASDPGEDEDEQSEGSFGSNLLNDVELNFIYTSRGDLEVPRVPGLVYDPRNPLGVPAEIRPNLNWLPCGHNLRSGAAAA